MSARLGTSTLAACALLAAPAAAAPSGGTYSSPPAVIRAVACRVDCVGPSTARPGSVVRVSGEGMARVRSVVFLGGRGDADDRAVPALRWSARIADVRVPAGAPSGRVRVRNGDGAPSRPSTDVVKVTGVDAAAPGAGELGRPPSAGSADVDTSDRIDGRVETSTVFYAGSRKATFRYVVNGDTPLDVTVDVVRSADGVPVAQWTPGPVAPGAEQRVEWDGTTAGQVVPEGRYAFRVSPRSASAAQAGEPAPVVQDGFRLLDHKFPVRGPHDYGGDSVRFGAARSGRTHQGQDVAAACGTPVVAARAGVVVRKAFEASAGNYVVVDGEGTDVDYAYMHLQQPARVEQGDRVLTGERLASVGDTGDATGCHLHFEMWGAPGWYEGGRPFDPLGLLRIWDAQSGTPAPPVRDAARR